MNRFTCIGLPVAVLSLVGLLSARAVAADKDVVAQMDANKVTLTKAIEAAEAGSKGKATAAMAKMDGDKLAFVVHAVVGDKVMEVPVDATGKAGAAKDASEATVMTAHATKAPELWKAMDTSKFTLAKAISTAETESKGKAIAVKSKKEGDKILFEVTTVVGDKTVPVKVDHTTGKVVK